VAGSVPAGIGPRGQAAIVEVCRRAGRPLLVDASGVGLAAALEAGPDVVKVGRIEVVEAGLAASGASTLETALALVERGARLAVVTDGARAVAAADGERAWRVAVPRVEAVNAVGSGDAFNAALSLALLDDEPIEVALARGVAAGSANAMALTAGMLDPAVARELEQESLVVQVGREASTWVD
jgi:tagatose 6-phosphate kinase